MKNLLKIVSSVLLTFSPIAGLVAHGLGSDYNWLLFIATGCLVITLCICSLGVALLTISFGVVVGLISSLFSPTPLLISICSSICFVNIWNSFNGVAALFSYMKHN